jgi:hypothetical protein
LSRKLAPLVLGAAALILVSVALGGTGANTVRFNAVLTVDKNVPAAKRPAGAIGHFSATLTGSTLRWTITYAGLTGVATESHIHGGQTSPERFQAVVVPLCGSYLNYGLPCRSGMTRTAKLDARSVALIKTGKTYVNVHTDKNPDGEIRGMIKVAP